MSKAVETIPETAHLAPDRPAHLSTDRLEGEPGANGLTPTPDYTPTQLRQMSLQDDWTRVRRGLLTAGKRRDPNGARQLQRMCDKVMDMAIDGNMKAVEFITERIDGKVPTPIDIDANISVSSIGEAHLHALQRLTDAVTRHDDAKTIDVKALDTDDQELDSA